jgi:hypothetical protein
MGNIVYDTVTAASGGTTHSHPDLATRYTLVVKKFLNGNSAAVGKMQARLVLSCTVCVCRPSVCLRWIGCERHPIGIGRDADIERWTNELAIAAGTHVVC